MGRGLTLTRQRGAAGSLRVPDLIAQAGSDAVTIGNLLIEAVKTPAAAHSAAASANLQASPAPVAREFRFLRWDPERRLFVDVPKPDPTEPGAFRYAEVDTLLTLLTNAGFRELAVRDWRAPLPIGGGLPSGEAASFALAAFASFGELLATVDEVARKEALRLLTESFARHAQDGTVCVDACVHIVTGTRE